MWNVNEVINENHRNIEEYYEDKTKEAYKRIGGSLGVTGYAKMEYQKL